MLICRVQLAATATYKSWSCATDILIIKILINFIYVYNMYDMSDSFTTTMEDRVYQKGPKTHTCHTCYQEIPQHNMPSVPVS